MPAATAEEAVQRCIAAVATARRCAERQHPGCAEALDAMAYALAKRLVREALGRDAGDEDLKSLKEAA